jgi:hypothetical protein
MYFKEEGRDKTSFSSKGPVTWYLDQFEPIHKIGITYSRRCIGSVDCNHVIVLSVIAGLNEFFSRSVFILLHESSIEVFPFERIHTFKFKIAERLSHSFLACVIFPINNAACEDMLPMGRLLNTGAALLSSRPLTLVFL